ncbi:MAG: cobalamin biosynthesis protein CobD [Chloroflexi bacterium]|nr:cobalamin biosynthesis protein CobD [Chloroflexota bacterium]
MRQRLLILGAALLWDRFFGEPPARVHPVVGVGKVIDAAMEHGIRGDPRKDQARGVIMAVAIPMAVFGMTAAAMGALGRLGSIPAILGGAFLLKSSFAISAMETEGRRVAAALAAGDLPGARESLSGIVSRDVSALDESGVASAAISTIAENVADSAVGPMLAYGVFGVPGAMAYRAINTMDTMAGYRDHRADFGRAAAKLDDAANWVPARVAGGAVVASAAMRGMDSRSAARTMLRQHSRTESPNGGWPIGATAGALGVEVEKVGHYRLGPESRSAEGPDIDRSLRLFAGAAAVGAVIAAGLILARR